MSEHRAKQARTPESIERSRQRSRAPTRPRLVRAAVLREKALELRVAGKTERQIAAELKVSNARAHELLIESLKEAAERRLEKADDLRAIEEARLDMMFQKLWPAVKRGDKRAIEVALKVAERRSRMFGLDVSKIDLSGSLGLGPALQIFIPQEEGGAAPVDSAPAELPVQRPPEVASEPAAEDPTT